MATGMKLDQTAETIIGAVVAMIAVAFVWHAVASTGSSDGTGGYRLTAQFNRVDGVAVGSDVRLSGVKVGSVESVSINPGDTPLPYYAKVQLSIRSDVTLPDDSAARIASDGLLGGAYVSLEPGGSEEKLKPGGEIFQTQGSVDLLTLFSSALSGQGGQTESN